MTLLPLVLLTSCLPVLPEVLDQDGDGYTEQVDSTDEDPAVLPGAAEGECYEEIGSNCSEHSNPDWGPLTEQGFGTPSTFPVTGASSVLLIGENP